MFAFSKIIDLFTDGYCLLLPPDGNQVNLVYSCFKQATVDSRGRISCLWNLRKQQEIFSLQMCEHRLGSVVSVFS